MEDQKKTTDPQQQEQDGNILGGPFEKVFGDSTGETSLEDTPEEQDKKGEGQA